MCWLAKGLIAVCVGYMPASGDTVTVKRSCVASYSNVVKFAAKACAREHNIKYRVQG